METNDEPRKEAEMSPDQLQSDIDTIKNVLSESDRHNDIHRIIIAASNFLCAVFLLIAVPFILLAVGIVGVATPEMEPGAPSPTMIVGAAAMIPIAILAVLSLPFILAGWGVLKRKSWGSVMAVFTGILNLPNIPLGTALGIYTFWAVIQGKLTPR